MSKYFTYRGRAVAIKPNYGILEIWIDRKWTGCGSSCNTYPGTERLAKFLIDSECAETQEAMSEIRK